MTGIEPVIFCYSYMSENPMVKGLGFPPRWVPMVKGLAPIAASWY